MSSLSLAICVAGMPGSGKSLVAEVARGLGIKVVSLGDVVRKEAERRGLPTDGKTLGQLMVKIREELGSSAVAKLSLRELEEGVDVVVFEGVRSLAEVKAFKKRFKNTVIVAVHAPPRSRLKRLKLRGRSDAPSSVREFKERDERELKVGLGEVLALADYVVVNDSTLRVAKRRAEVVLKKVLRRGDVRWGR
ncbi:MAG: AAA family ATPase [Candidatus Nezhaarchaeota archaeon]|nr:AAA family ATPase [Candidatus Nezhaarchaeota archaeon]